MATTWNPSDIGSNVALSNGNLTATSSTSSETGVRASLSRAGSISGVRYLEVTAGPTFGVNSGMALVNSSASFSSGAGSVFLVLQSGQIYVANSAQFISIGTISPGDVVGMLIDFPNLLGWFNRNGGNWNGSASTTPTAGNSVGLSGIFTSSMQVFPMQYFGASGSSATANFGATAFAHLPAGATAWDPTTAGAGVVPFNPPMRAGVRSMGGGFAG